MKSKHLFLGLAFSNFIANLVIAGMLPRNVPVWTNFNLKVSALGSPWLLLIYAAIPLLGAIGIYFQDFIEQNGTKRKWLSILLYSVVAAFIYFNWLAIALALTGAGLGTSVYISLALVLGNVFAMVLLLLGAFLPYSQLNSKFSLPLKDANKNEFVHKELHVSTGICLDVLAVVMFFGSLTGFFNIKVEWVTAIFFGVTLVFAILFPIFYRSTVLKEDERRRTRF